MIEHNIKAILQELVVEREKLTSQLNTLKQEEQILIDREKILNWILEYTDEMQQLIIGDMIKISKYSS